MIVVMHRRLRRAHHQAAVLHALGADQQVGQFLYIFGFAAKDNHLKTTVVIKVSMQGGNNNVVVFVLKIGKFFGKQSGVVVVDERDGPNHEGSRRHYR